MKSAYELAMERLAKSDPEVTKPLSAQAKARLAEVDLLYKGKLAERDVFLNGKLEAALADGNLPEVEQLRRQLADERSRLEEEREEEKDRVRRAS